jgi:hypothetical protein
MLQALACTDGLYNFQAMLSIPPAASTFINGTLETEI